MLLGKIRDRPILKSEIDYYGINQGWVNALKLDPLTLLDRFQSAGLIVALVPKCHVKIMLDAFTTVAQLKEALEKAGAKKTGKKSDLINRLIEASEDEVMKMIPREACWGITKKGAEIVDNYRLQKKAEKEDLEEKLLALVLSRMYSQAAQLRAEHNSRQVFPPGLGCDWSDWNIQRDVDILTVISDLTPNILDDLSATDLRPARVNASLQYLYGARISARLREKMLSTMSIASDQEGDQLEFQARQLLAFALGKVNLDEWKSRSVEFVKILSCGDESCTTCQKISRKKYPITEAPQLPHEDCTELRGCRCCYVPA